MRSFKQKELIGEWSNQEWRFSLSEKDNLKLYWLDSKKETDGTFKLFENFLIFEYSNDFQKIQWISRIEELKKNHLVLTDLSSKVGQIEKMKRTFFNKKLIKQFEFDCLNELNIDEVKEVLKIDTLQLNSVKNLKGKKTNYFRHWDNDNRLAITIKNDLLEKIKANRNTILLSVEKEIKLANLGYYTNLSIIEYDDTEYFDVFDERAVYDDYNYNNNWSYDESNWLSDAAGTNDPEVMNDVKWNLD